MSFIRPFFCSAVRPVTAKTTTSGIDLLRWDLSELAGRTVCASATLPGNSHSFSLRSAQIPVLAGAQSR
jgi:hypothetical protein